MKISLIMATLGNAQFVERFCSFLNNQTYKNFELIVVDQNTDGRLEEIIKKYVRFFKIIHLFSSPGLSKARNAGLLHVSGDIIAFPDDDCWYSSELLKDVIDIFNKNMVDGITGRIDSKGMGRFDRKEGLVNKFNVWERAISVSIFLKKDVIDSVGFFDEDLGLGSDKLMQSGEETDYIIRCIEKGFKIKYFPELIVNHPESVPDFNDIKAYKRAYKYGIGCGYVLKQYNYSILIKAKFLIRPVLGAMLALSMNRKGLAKYRCCSFLGRAKGLWGISIK
jgi:glycosyltransferase involved in cell wall biosynthesis